MSPHSSAERALAEQGTTARVPVVPHAGGASALGGRLRRAPALVVGLLAWSLTVLPVLSEPGAMPAARFSAALAAVALVGAGLVPRGAWTLFLGIDLFLFASGAAWLLAAIADSLPAPTALGVMVWVLFPLAWGALSSPAPVPGASPADPGPLLEPRKRLGGALFLGSVGAGFVALFVLLAMTRTGRVEADLLLGVGTLGFAVLAVHTGARFLEAGASDPGRFSWARLLLRLRGPALLLAAAALALVALGLLGSSGR